MTKIALAVGNNIVPNTQVFTFGLPTIPPADDYYLTFVAVDNINTVYAKSGLVPITDKPQSSSIPVSTPTNTPSVTGHSTRLVSCFLESFSPYSLGMRLGQTG